MSLVFFAAYVPVHHGHYANFYMLHKTKPSAPLNTPSSRLLRHTATSLSRQVRSHEKDSVQESFSTESGLARLKRISNKDKEPQHTAPMSLFDDFDLETGVLDEFLDDKTPASQLTIKTKEGIQDSLLEQYLQGEDDVSIILLDSFDLLGSDSKDNQPREEVLGKSDETNESHDSVTEHFRTNAKIEGAFERNGDQRHEAREGSVNPVALILSKEGAERLFHRGDDSIPFSFSGKSSAFLELKTSTALDDES